jgi:zinc D-Ala-D-Ala carboxypeptidase
MDKISEHISYVEATRSNTAIRMGVKNDPNKEQLEAMKLVAEKVFEPVRKIANRPITVSSFFRSPKLNKAIGGSETSQHPKGEAIDMDSVYFLLDPGEP